MRLLFIMDTFPLGGISKSLLALFNELDSAKYDIDFLLMKQEGIFIPMIPKNIRLLPELLPYEFRNPDPKKICEYYATLPLRQWIKWVGYSLKCCIGRLIGGRHRHIQTMDEWIGRNTPGLADHYDAAIAYQGGRCIYYLVNNVNADVKIGYVHSDYNVSEMDWLLYRTDCKYFPRLDYIVTISPECQSSLCKRFPDLIEKICVVENICSVKTITSMSHLDEGFTDGFQGARIVTMGRLDIQTKGIDFAINATKILRERGFNFRWYFLGDGNQRNEVERLICSAQVEDCFILLGAKTNPYPYILQADIYVQPSRYEGKSVALDEVKALRKPVVVTNFSTVYDQFRDGETALICEMKPECIEEKIQMLLSDPTLRQRLVSNLENEKVGNEEQAQVFESLIVGKV